LVFASSARCTVALGASVEQSARCNGPQILTLLAPPRAPRRPSRLTPQGKQYDAFVKVAQKSEDAAFFETTDAAVGKAAGLSAPGVAVITNFEGARPLRGGQGAPWRCSSELRAGPSVVWTRPTLTPTLAAAATPPQTRRAPPRA
jgi:hypothetical protein